MRICDNGTVRDMTADEIAKQQAGSEQAEREYWANIPYDEAVNNELLKRYTESQIIVILSEKDENPTEYANYRSYYEQCKAFVKAKKAEVDNGTN